MAISLSDINKELAARDGMGNAALDEIDAELSKRGVQPEISLGEIAGQATKAALTGPYDATKKFFETDPATMQRVGGVALPIAGGAVGGPIGAAAGEFARQATGAAFAPETVPHTPLGSAASVIGASIAQEPKMLNAIPGVPQATEAVTNLASKAGSGLAKAAQAFSGGRAKDFIDAAKKGYATYAAPSIEKARASFGNALKGQGGAAIPVAESVKSILEPEASAARKTVVDLVERVAKGEKLSPAEALAGRQAVDDVIESTPFWQGKKRGKQFDIRKQFDEILSSMSGELKAESAKYRASILKDNLTKFLPVNKHGEYSRLAPMLSSLGGALTGVNSSDAKKGAGATAGYLLATSPLALGALATSGGSAAKLFGTLASRPEVRQVLLQTLQRILSKQESK